MVGAGDVTSTEDVSNVVNAGGKLIVAPNMDSAVGIRACELDVSWYPRIATPAEALEALKLGAVILTLSPAEHISPSAVKSMRSSLPADASIAIVGGVTPEVMHDYLDAGVNTFGLDSLLYKPEYGIDELRLRALSFATELNRYKLR